MLQHPIVLSEVWQKTLAFDYDGVEPMVFCVFRKAEAAVSGSL